MNVELTELLDTGAQHGLTQPERNVLESLLIQENLGSELSAFRHQVAGVKPEELLSPENVRGFQRTLGRGVDVSVRELGIARLTPPAPPSPTPSARPARKKVKAMPANADLSGFRKRFPKHKVVGMYRTFGKDRLMLVAKDAKGVETILPCKLGAKPVRSLPTPSRLPSSFDFPPKRQTAPPLKPRVMTPRQQWENSQDLQFTFPTVAIYESFKLAESRGQVLISKRRKQ